MWAKLAKNWFLIALALCYVVGYAGGEVLRPLLEMSALRSGVVFIVMWAMGVTLEASAIRRSLTKPVPSLLAIACNMFVVPVLCLPLMWLLPSSMFGGLFIAAIVPCTLASASVWTRKAGGDDSIAMMTTVVTNLACVIVVPIGMVAVLSQQSEIQIADQIRKLCVLVVLPLVLAQTMRRCGAAALADRLNSRIALLGQIGILVMVLIGAIASAQVVDGKTAAAFNPVTIATLFVLAAALHTAVLCIGIGLARAFGLIRPSQIAVGISGSQKTLTIGLQIAIDCGVSVVPMLVYHFNQLIIDTFVADRWKKSDVHSASASTTAATSRSGR